jgi:hypothetical protein
MLDEAGFAGVEAFSDWEGRTPPSASERLILRARRAVE